MDVHLSVILDENRLDSFCHLDEGRVNPCRGIAYSSTVILSDKLTRATRQFSFLVEKLYKRNAKGKLELLTSGGNPILRVRRPAPGVAYRFFRPDVPVKRVFNFLNRQALFPAPSRKLESGCFNLIIGRNGEKFLHEWLSHPSEEGNLLPEAVTLSSIKPHFYSPSRPRLVWGQIRCDTPVSVPDSWLLIRTVTAGAYRNRDREVFFSVSESFMRKRGLVQSLYPARVSVKLDDLNRGFSGCLSRRDMTGSGFICSKFGETVFGRIHSPALLFSEIPLKVEV